MFQTITTTDFVHAFREIWNSSDRKLCFILGAGASKSSGIKTGGELAKEWLSQIEDRLSDRDGLFEQFLNKHKIDKETPGAHYPQIYDERFRLDPDSGFEYINKEMDDARPGYGYSVLAQILAQKHHNIVITTNFDGLTEEAIYTYTTKRPLVCGHESLAGFAKPSTNRPLIVKIHRDRFFGPQSQSGEVNKMNEAWNEALNYIFQNSTPVFIGYGGNDGSLMNYLAQISQFKNLFWCEIKGSAIPDKVSDFLNSKKGNLVEIDGFDELMYLLQATLKLPLLNTEIVTVAETRAKNYRETFEKIQTNRSKSSDPEVKKATEQLVNNLGNDWWEWELKATAAKDMHEKDKIYQDGIRAVPKSAELIGNYAVFLQNIRKNYDLANHYYKKSLDIDPENAINNGNYALFIDDILKNYNLAEQHYKKALEIDPLNANNNGNYACFLENILKNYDLAEQYYKKALEIDPLNANNNGNYALFLERTLKNYDLAEHYYKKSLEIDPGNANNNGNYAFFLENILKNYDLAEQYYKKALEIDPLNANNNGNYAVFLQNIRKNYDLANHYYKKSLDIDPENAINNGNYAIFLDDILKNYDLAEQYYKKALEVNPLDADYNGNYALFLATYRKDFATAKYYYEKVMEIDPSDANNNGNYAGFLLATGDTSKYIPYFTKAQENGIDDALQAELKFYQYAHIPEERTMALAELKNLLCKGVRSIDFSLQNNIDRAIKDGHPDPQLLQRLADILTKDAPVGDLCGQ